MKRNTWNDFSKIIKYNPFLSTEHSLSDNRKSFGIVSTVFSMFFEIWCVFTEAGISVCMFLFPSCIDIIYDLMCVSTIWHWVHYLPNCWVLDLQWTIWLADRIAEHIRSIRSNFSGFPVAQHFNHLSHCSLNDFSVTGIIHCNCSNVNRLNIENCIFLNSETYLRFDLRQIWRIFLYVNFTHSIVYTALFLNSTNRLVGIQQWAY